jgi:hypothetical protein
VNGEEEKPRKDANVTLVGVETTLQDILQTKKEHDEALQREKESEK